MIKTAHGSRLRAVLLAMSMLATALVAFAGTRSAQTAFPDRRIPIAFEKDGNVWVASKIHLANLTPNTTAYNDADPAVSPDGRKVAFASDRDGDFEVYIANTFTGEVERLTDNAVDDRNPSWSPDSQWISYQSSHYSWPTHSGIFSAKLKGTAVP